MTILTPSAQKSNASAQSAQSVSASSHIGADAQEIFESELKQGAIVIAQFLSDIEKKKQKFTYSPDLVVKAARDVESKGRLNTSALPMSKDQKLRLELLLYHYEEDLIIQVTRRTEIEREYKFTPEKFDKVYYIFREGLDPGIDQEEVLRLELKALMAETDSVKRTKKKREIATRFKMSYRDITEMLEGVRQETRRRKCRRLSLEPIWQGEETKIEWIIPGLLPKNETVLLVAHAKTGKTLLGVDLGVGLATDQGSFVGEPIESAKVLVISVDQSESTTINQLKERGFSFKSNPNLEVLTDWDITQMSELESVLEDFRPDVTIIDCLRRITLNEKIDENSSQFGDYVYSIKETLGRYNSAGILIHHTNRSGQSGIESVRGSTAIAGAVWGVWHLDYHRDKKGNYDPEDTGRALHIRPRSSESQTMYLDLDLEFFTFTRILTEADKEKASQADQVLDLLEKHPNGLNVSAISHLTGIPDKSLYSVLGRLREKGKVENEIVFDNGEKPRKVWRIKTTQNKVQQISQTVEIHTQQGTEESNKQSNKHLISENQPTTKNQTQQGTEESNKQSNKHLISENQPTTVACSPVENPTPPVKKPTQPNAPRGFAGSSNQPDAIAHLIAEIEKWVKTKGISQKELDGLIRGVYGNEDTERKELKDIGPVALETLLKEIKSLSVEHSIK